MILTGCIRVFITMTQNWFIISVILTFFIRSSEQYVASPTCFGQICPTSTTSCKEHKQSIPERGLIEVKISCLDDYDGSLKEYYFEERSNLDRFTAYRNTRYESIDEGISHSQYPYKDQSLDLTPHGRTEYF
ncbi:uncharacterized protein [Euwallacea fornicatus]|uniref:uncharacterized protein n=1 Tax=Euwallacea fornicatus TaxID=995702 RepID=UPI00338EDBFC